MSIGGPCSRLGDHKYPSSTMITARPRKRLGVIVRAGAAEGQCGDPCGCPGEVRGHSPSYYKRCQGESAPLFLTLFLWTGKTPARAQRGESGWRGPIDRALGPYKYRFFGQLISECVCVPAHGVSASVAAPFPSDAASCSPRKAWAVSWVG